MRGTTLFRWSWRCTTHSGKIWIVLSKSVLIFSTIDDEVIIYPCIFLFNFFKQRVNISLYALTFAIKRKIELMSDVCSKPPIIIRSHDLHASDIKRAVGEITSYDEKD